MKEKSPHDDKPIFGLDFLRAGALVLVLFSHLLLFYPNQNGITMQLAPLSGFLGVEAFLVLSGFLIGNKVYAMMILQNQLSRAEVLQYLKQRSWRILPNYFLVLIVAIALAFGFQYATKDLWKYFFLVQNFAYPMPPFFIESWCVTIVFFGNMLLILAMCFVLNRSQIKNKSAAFLVVVVLLILISLACKFGYYLTTNNTTLLQWDSDLKSVVIYRWDSFFIGTLAGWIYFNATAFWEKYKNLCLVCGFVLMGMMFVGVGYFQWLIDANPFFWNVLYLPITSIAIALILPVFSQWNLKGILKAVIRFISKISYAVYLLHYTVLLQLMRNLFDLKTCNATEFCIFSVGYLIIAMLLGFVLYQFYEKPLSQRTTNN